MTLDTKALKAAARAVYAVLPNFGMEWQPNTAGGHSQVRVDDSWEDAPDRHEDCIRQAQAAIEAYLSFSATPSRNDILEEAMNAAIAYNDNYGDPADTWHHGCAIIEAIRALVKP